MSNLFQIGLSGLNVSQASLNTTAHNIANINTEGYSRQVTLAETRGAERQGNIFMGRGAQIGSISRQFSEFAYSEYIINTTSQSYFETRFTNAARIDSVVSDEDTSVSQDMLSMFSSINGFADHPNTIEARSVFIEDAKNMVNTFNRLYDQARLQFDSVNDDIERTVESINTFSDNIAKINLDILTALSGDTSREANDLADQRDEQIRQLSELVNVSVIKLSNGMVNVTMGTGQPLVLGAQATVLGTQPGNPDTQDIQVVIEASGAQIPVDGTVLGGSLQSLYDVRDQVLVPTFTSLGLNAMGITHSINEQQKQGQDLDGAIGEPLFYDYNSTTAQRGRVMSHNDSLGEAQLSLRIDDLSLMTIDEYELRVISYTPAAPGPEAIQFELTNLTTGATSNLPAAGAQDLTVNQRITIPNTGLSLGIESISAGDPPQVGKRFTIRPTRTAANDLSLIQDDPRKVAAADAEVKVAAVSTNTGNATLSVTSIDDRADGLYPVKNQPMTIAFTGVAAGPPTVYQYEIRDSAGTVITVPAGESYTLIDNTGAAVTKNAGDQLNNLGFSLDILSNRYSGMQFAGVTLEFDGISGGPAVGDQFTISYNETGDGDNRNALLMAQLQTDKILGQGKQTFQDNYSAMISWVGAITKNAEISLTSSETLLNQSRERLQAISGVNLDEEASNLIRYQQSYNASARVITVANELFDTILQSIR
ncbi:flagellar hook-associated protein FlgK [Dongshaea marina]|uniref:flagellar hook-associated protein FlgK n=1 Tax=Dongshaea marina TaxID=2047966 RepID=UPI000D3E450B|nr:flagellar hook-associated protein FlgK [Dongshaea marina]